MRRPRDPAGQDRPPSSWRAWIHRPHAIAAAVTFVVMTTIGFLPLFGGPGYEHALATGILVPSIAAISTALWVEASESPSASLRRGVLVGLALAAVSLVTAFGHGLRVGICELWGALVDFALTAGAGCVMGGAWGAVAGELAAFVLRHRPRVTRRQRTAVAVVLALLGPVLGVALSLYRFVASPMIFAFDPFVGFFSGTLYDTVIDAGSALWTYRLGSLATLSSLALLSSVVRRDGAGKLSFDLGSSAARARFALGLLAALASASTLVFGAKLHHFSTPSSIAHDLGAEKHGARCDVVYPSTTREDQADLLVKDCDEEIAAVEARLGAKGPPRVRAFFFRDENEKKLLMGAGRTYIAKPWRKEVYLQIASYPHPVLGHELAHVVAGSFGRGPFRIAGRVSGLLPNPGLIEGVAVFASPDDDELSDGEWAAAMLRIGILPPMERVFSLGFLGDASAKSYTLAGAFVDWLARTRGVDVVRAWYGGADVEAVTGSSWTALDEAFRAHLASLPLAPGVESFARAKFERPGIFGRTCPHVVDALRADADACRDSQRFEEALRLYREVLARDATDFSSRTSMAVIERRHGDREAGARALLDMVQDARVPRTYRDRAGDALADADFVDGRFDRAAARYEALAAQAVDEDAVRHLEVKAIGARDEAARPAVRALLLGDDRHGPDIFDAGVRLGAWSASDDSPLANYLVGRNLASRGLYDEAARALDRVVTRLPAIGSKSVAREALRQRGVVACALGDRSGVESVRSRLAAADGPFEGRGSGRLDATRALLDRCSTR